MSITSKEESKDVEEMVSWLEFNLSMIRDKLSIKDMGDIIYNSYPHPDIDVLIEYLNNKNKKN